MRINFRLNWRWLCCNCGGAALALRHYEQKRIIEPKPENRKPKTENRQAKKQMITNELEWLANSIYLCFGVSALMNEDENDRIIEYNRLIVALMCYCQAAIFHRWNHQHPTFRIFIATRRKCGNALNRFSHRIRIFFTFALVMRWTGGSKSGRIATGAIVSPSKSQRAYFRHFEDIRKNSDKSLENWTNKNFAEFIGICYSLKLDAMTGHVEQTIEAYGGGEGLYSPRANIVSVR